MKTLYNKIVFERKSKNVVFFLQRMLFFCLKGNVFHILIIIFVCSFL